MSFTCIVFLAFIAVFAFADTGRAWMESDLRVMHPHPNAPLDLQRKVVGEFAMAGDPLLVYLSAPDDQALVRLAHEVRQRVESPLVQPFISGSYGLAHLLPDTRKIEGRLAGIERISSERVVADFTAALDRSVFEPQRFEPYARYLGDLLRPARVPTLRDLRDYPTASAFLSRDPSGAEAVTFLFPTQSVEGRAFRRQAIGALREALSGLDGAVLTGMDVIADDAERAIHGELSAMAWAAGLFVFVWLIIYFRRLRDVWLALCPVLFAAAATLACMSLTDMKLNMVNIVAVPLLIGLGIDYGIFSVSVARQQATPSGRLSFFASSGMAVLLSSVTTVTGFGSLVTTSVPAIQSLGAMLAIGIGASLFATLFGLVPWLLGSEGGDANEP